MIPVGKTECRYMAQIRLSFNMWPKSEYEGGYLQSRPTGMLSLFLEFDFFDANYKVFL